MGVLSRLLKPPTEPERRDTSSAMLAMLSGGGSSASGVSVTPESSLAYSAVLACVRVLAESVAQLPLILYERQDRGRQRATDHPLSALLHTSPNPVITSFEWREVMMAHLTLWGNSFCEIERNGAGRPLALWPLLPDKMTINERDGQRWYEYELDNGKKISMRSDQVLHVPGFGYDGLAGKSLIRLARESVGLGIAAGRYGATVFGSGEVPGGVLQHPGVLGDEAYKRLRESWAERHGGLSKANRLAILEEGMTYTKTGVPPEDAQFLETRRFQRTEIAAIFRVPPHMIGDLERATFSNIEQQSLDFVIYTIGPWLVRIEQRINMSLLSEVERKRYYVEHLVAGLLRGDIKARFDAYAVARGWGWMSANDVRELENQNPVDGGDTYLVPMNMVDAAAGPVAPETTPADQANRAADQRYKAQTDEIKQAEAYLEANAGRELRAVGRRRRLSSVGEGQISDAAQRVVNRESNDILNAAKRFGRRPEGLADFRKWLNDFLDNHQPVVHERLWSSMWSLAQLAADEAHTEAQEAGHEGELDEDGLRRFAEDYMGSRAAGWVGMLRADLYAALDRAEASGTRAAEPDPAWLNETEAVIERRRENEADSWGRDESNRIVNAVAVTVWAAIGVMFLRWASSGENCPYCDKMNGRTVGIAQWFVQAGDGVAIEGLPSLRPGSNTRHPPLHRGCDCNILIG